MRFALAEGNSENRVLRVTSAERSWPG